MSKALYFYNNKNEKEKIFEKKKEKERKNLKKKLSLMNEKTNYKGKSFSPSCLVYLGSLAQKATVSV